MVKNLINTRSSTVRSFSVIVVVLVISVMMIGTNMGRASAAAAEAAYISNGGFLIIDGDDQWGNATTTGTGGGIEEMAEMEEFLMDSEANRRQLAATRSRSLSYGSFTRGPICNAQRYGSCIGQKLNNGNRCTLENRCKH